MSRVLAVILILIAFGIGVGAGVVGILYATGDVAPSQSAADAAPTLSLDQSTPTPGLLNQMATSVADNNAKIDTLATEVGVLREQGMAGGQSDAPEMTEEAAATEEADTDDETASAEGDLPERALFRIDPSQSEVRFNIDETLLGNAIVVVGATSEVAGDIIVNYQDPAASQVGEIAINARTLRTDNDFRNDALRGQILDTGEFEFIRFVPTEILSLTDAVAVGDEVTFEMAGDLTIRDTTNPVTFDVTLTADSLDQISGFAETQVEYADYGIEINAPPSVSNIGDVVTLQIEFVATQVDEDA